MAGYGGYLKKHTEALVKDVGIEAACELTGKSKATLGRYYSDSSEHAEPSAKPQPQSAAPPANCCSQLPCTTGQPSAMMRASVSRGWAQ